MDEYQIVDPSRSLMVLEDEPEAAVLTIMLDAGQRHLELTADPNDSSITLWATGQEISDDLTFDVEDFALLTTLLIRQARRA